MGGVRFSLAGVMLAVFGIALAFAALRAASSRWAATVFSLSLLILLLAILGALFSREGQRAFWSGFAIFGWAYLLLALGPWFSQHTGPHLITTRLITFSFEHLAPLPLRAGDKILVQWGGRWWPCTLLEIRGNQYLIHYDGYSSASDELVPVGRIRRGDPEGFMRVGHSLFGLLLALVGGGAATWFFVTSQGRDLPVGPIRSRLVSR